MQNLWINIFQVKVQGLDGGSMDLRKTKGINIVMHHWTVDSFPNIITIPDRKAKCSIAN